MIRRFPVGGRYRLATLAVAMVWTVSRSDAAVVEAPFRLCEGHRARDELCFSVSAPGPIRVRVENDAPGVPLYVMLQPPSRVPVANPRVDRAIEFAYVPSAQDLAAGVEWAVAVRAMDGRSPAAGRIRVEHPGGPAPAGHPVDDWLFRHPAVASHMGWRGERDGSTRPYSAWPADMKDRLRVFFDGARAGRPAVLSDPPPNQVRPGDAEDPRTVLSVGHARDLYLASVAHSLALEHDRRLPWSVLDGNAAEMDALFDSLSFFHRRADGPGYEIVSLRHGWGIPAPPATAFAFLQSNRMLAGTRRETIVALVTWCRGLSHYAGSIGTSTYEDHWGYRGYMPVSKALAGTRYAGVEFRGVFGDGPRHFTAGCHGTVALLVSVLRAANIPALYRGAPAADSTHATAIFLSEDLALTHGDDPYSRLAVRAPTEEMLVDLPTYLEWLGPASGRTDCIGRQAMLLGLKYLAPELVDLHRQDRADGRSRESSRVRDCFRVGITLADLEAARLWERLDAEVEAGAPAQAAPPKRGPVSMPPPPNAALNLEAEDLAATVSSGRIDIQPMDGFAGATWSGGRQLWWTGAGEGDSLRLAFRVPAAGVYRLSAVFTRAPDYGIFALTVDGGAAGVGTVDLYGAGVTRTDPIPLGTFKFSAGDHHFGASAAGRNPSSQPGLMFGLDVLMGERIE